MLNPAELPEISSALKPNTGFYFHFFTYSKTAQAILIYASFDPSALNLNRYLAIPGLTFQSKSSVSRCHLREKMKFCYKQF